MSNKRDRKDEDQRLSSSSKGIHKELTKKDFNKLLLDIAQWHDRQELLQMLKVVLRDHITSYELDKAKHTRDLSCLNISGDLTHGNIDILYDIVKVTRQYNFSSTVKDQFPLFQNIAYREISKFTSHRQKLVRLGNVLTQNDVEVLDGIYNTLLKKYECNWTLIMDLEKRGIFDEDKIEAFIEDLRENEIDLAVNVFIEGTSYLPVCKKPKLMVVNTEDECIRKYLLKRQQKTCFNVNQYTPATMNSAYHLEIEHMFTDLDLLKENKKKICPKPITLNEILLIIKSTPACKVLIEGEGGIGKTTLLRYLAYNWATGKDVTFSDKIVFLVRIREIGKEEDVLDVIVKQIKLKDFLLKTGLLNDPILLIKKFIIDHDHQIVLLLDGLDELQLGNESPISLIKNEELENSLVILTSRSEKIDEYIKYSTVHVKIKGFNSDSIRTYITKHFNFIEEPSMSKSLIFKLELDKKLSNRQYQEINSMCKNPMLLLAICNMWEERQDLPVDKVDLFNEIYRCILNQYIDKIRGKEKISDFKAAPLEYISAMLALGKCMFNELKYNRLTIDERAIDAKTDILRLALKLGFVYKDPPNSKSRFEQIFTAPHKLIVESLVGFYIYKTCQLNDGENDLRNEWEIIRENPYLDTAREFAIGFLEDRAGDFLKHYITKRFSTYRSIPRDLQFVKESNRHTVEAALISFINTEIEDQTRQCIKELSKTLSEFTRYVHNCEVIQPNNFVLLLQTCFHTLGKDSEVPQKVIKFVNSKPSDDRGRVLADILIALPKQRHTLQRVTEMFTDDIFKELQIRCKQLHFNYDITKYELDKNKLTSLYLSHILTNSPKLIQLSLKNSISGINFASFINEYRGNHLVLTKLDVTGNDLSNFSGSILASLLSLAPMLTTLDIVDCYLSGDIVNDAVKECFAKNLKLNLRTLQMDKNDLYNIHGSILAFLFDIAPELTYLHISQCNIASNVLKTMITACKVKSSRMVLGSIRLSGSNLGDIDGNTLALLFFIAPKLFFLDIGNCSLSGAVINEMIIKCQDQGTNFLLDYLDIRGNDLSNLNGSLFSVLVTIPTLFSLNISKCKITSAIFRDIFSSFDSSTELALGWFDVSGNEFNDINESTITHFIQIAPKLYTFEIMDSNLSVSVKKHVVSECNRCGVYLDIDE